MNLMGEEAMKILDIDHIELYVGDAIAAAQSLCAVRRANPACQSCMHRSRSSTSSAGGVPSAALPSRLTRKLADCCERRSTRVAIFDPEFVNRVLPVAISADR